MALPLLINPAERVRPGMVIESADALLDGAFYAQRLLHEPLAEVRAELDRGADFPSDLAIDRVSVEVSRAVRRLSRGYDPTLVTLETRVAEDSGAGASFGALFIPGLLLMTLLFVGEGLSGDVWRERSQGTLRRAIASPRPARAFLAGKLLAGAIVIAGICTIALPAHAAFFGVAFDRVPLALAWTVFTGTAFLAALMLIQLLASQQRTAGVLTTMILFPLLMVGGSFFPFEIMPEWLARIGRATPNGWALTQLGAILRGGARAADLAVPFAVLSAVGIACFLLAARRVARGFANA
jgi:ABC-type multidrug transport system permease subunit